MAVIIRDRVQETTSTSGTGALALAGASAGFVSFGSVMAVGDTCRYCVVDGTANTWEVGTGTYSAASTLARTTVEASSNGGALVNLAGSAGTVVFLTASAAMLSGLVPPVSKPQFLNSFLDVSLQGSFSVTSATFTTIICPTVNSDAAGNYNTSSGMYRVPYAGTYQVVTKMRWQDAGYSNGPSSGQSYGQGAHTSNIDGAHFAWYVTNPVRNGALNTRIVHLNAGDMLRFYCYADGFSNAVNGGSMTVNLLSAD